MTEGDISYAGKTIWVIGASSGIGRALALELISRGASVLVSARNISALEGLAAESEHIKSLQVDVSAENQLSAAIEQMDAEQTLPDTVVFLAAFYQPASIHKITSEDLEKTLKVNLWAAFELVRLLTPKFYKRKAGQIALVGSVAGYRGLPKGQPYSATKAALINLAESLFLEAKPKGVDVKLISPGFVETPMTDKNEFVMPDIISTVEAARHIADGLQRTSFEIHFPKRFTRKLKLLRALPTRLYFKLIRKF